MDFFDLAKHGLIKTWDKSKFGLIFERPKRGEEKGKRKREKRKRKKKKRKRRSSKKVRNYMVLYGTTWAFKALNGFPCNCMVISCLQPRVFARVSS